MAIEVGTSGFATSIGGHILLRGAAPQRWLARYATVFRTCELNTTFYRLPSTDAVDGWRKGTPAAFTFAVEGSRYLTHVKRIKEAGTGVKRFFDVVSRLRGKLGPGALAAPAA